MGLSCVMLICFVSNEDDRLWSEKVSYQWRYIKKLGNHIIFFVVPSRSHPNFLQFGFFFRVHKLELALIVLVKISLKPLKDIESEQETSCERSKRSQFYFHAYRFFARRVFKIPEIFFKRFLGTL